MRDYANLPGAFGWPGENGLCGFNGIGIEWAGAVTFFGTFALATYNPTLRDRISADFHFSLSSISRHLAGCVEMKREMLHPQIFHGG